MPSLPRIVRRPLRLFLALVCLSFVGVSKGQAGEEDILIPYKDHQLFARLVTPDVPVQGIVLFVHGDGAMPFDGHGYYLPLFDEITAAGFAALSWDKPGVGESGGDWLAQSMTDRQNEVAHVLDFVKKRYGPAQIGLMGFSQAGWVVPALARQRSDIDFIMGVGFALNWQAQGWYMTRTRLQRQGASSAEIEQAYAHHRAEFDFLATEPSFAEYQKRFPADTEGLSEQRYGFILRNYGAEASSDYDGLDLPLLLMWGQEDRNVDSQRVYQTLSAQLGAQKTARLALIPEATHGLLNVADFDTDTPGWGFLVKLHWQGRDAFSPEALHLLRAFLQDRACN